LHRADPAQAAEIAQELPGQGEGACGPALLNEFVSNRQQPELN
jgi:hypothetical protein